MLNPAPMPFKVNRSGPGFPALTGFSLLDAQGPDAEAFLQAQLMNDVRALAPGRWQWNGWLTPKGRVIALFALVRTAPTSFLLILPDVAAGDLRLALQRFVFRSKVQLSVRADASCAAAFDGEAGGDFGPADAVHGDDLDGLQLAWHGEDGPRYLLVLPAGSPHLAASDPATDARWLAADLALGLPRLPVSQREAWTPQMLSLERLNAYSLKKGCYPGQEIVARTHYLGQAKRRLAGLSGTGLATGAELRDGAEKPLGTVIAATADGLRGLAVVPAGELPETRCAGRPVAFTPLVGGLQRPL